MDTAARPAPPAGRGHPLAGLPESVLVARAADGDPRAFEILLRRYQRPLYALAVRMLGDPEQAADAVQDALILAWRRLPQFRQQARFSTWAHRIVANQCLDRLRRRTPIVEPVTDRADLLPPAAVSDSPAVVVETRALAAAVTAALGDLPPPLRLAWLLRESEHRSYEEIAAITGTTVSTVRGRLARARAALADALQDWR